MIADERILIVGGKGMLGRELSAVARARGERRGAEVYDFDVEEIDITAADRVMRTLADLRPRLVINAAAYTDVDGCESHEEAATAVNADGPGNLAAACRAVGGRLIHVSTDYVFNGSKSSPWLPDDPIAPLNAYGRSKARGDDRIRETLADHAIVRTSWLFGFHGKNFVKTILKLSGEREELRVVTDQVGRPTYARDLADALLAIGRTAARGTFHFCNAGACSWNDFATEIVQLAGSKARVLPTTSAEFVRPAARPAYSVLSTESFTEATGITPRPWQQALSECVAELLRAGDAI